MVAKRQHPSPLMKNQVRANKAAKTGDSLGDVIGGLPPGHRQLREDGRGGPQPLGKGSGRAGPPGN